MTRALLAALAAISLSASAASAGPQEKSAGVGAAPVQVVAPVVLMPAGLSAPAAGPAGIALPGSVTAPQIQAVGAVPGAGALAPSAVTAQSGASSTAAGAPAQAAPASPPSGPPGNGSAASAPPSGPPNGPHRAPEDGPQPGSPSGSGESRVSPAALSQLKAELADLQRQEKKAQTMVSGAPQAGHEYRGGADEARGRAFETVADLRARIDAKKIEIGAVRNQEYRRYEGLKEELAALKSRRDAAKSLASASGSAAAGREYRGGADEARGRALESAASLDTQIAAKKKELALIERDHPSFAGLRAPVVRLKNALGLEPKTDAEKALHDEIRALDARAAKADMAAMQMFALQKDHPDVGMAEEGLKNRKLAEGFKAQAAEKRAQLKALRGR